MYSPFYELENNIYTPSEIQQTYSDRLINQSFDYSFNHVMN